MQERKGVITTSWDDGSWLDIKLAGLLDKYSLKGTFYIPKRFTNKPLNKNQIRKIAKHHEIGAHSLTHRDLTRLKSQELIKEVKDSKYYLEDIIQREVQMFAYPFGKFNAQVKKAVKAANFLGARTMSELHSEIIDPLEFGITMGTNILKIPLKSWFVLASMSAKGKIESKSTWHLAGHSWEIEHFGMWEILERLFVYLKGLSEKICIVNSMVLRR